MQRRIDKERDALKESRKTAAEIEFSPPRSFSDFKTRLPENRLEFGDPVEVIVDRLKA